VQFIFQRLYDTMPSIQKGERRERGDGIDKAGRWFVQK